MTTPDQALEQEIQAAGANVAPRITPADIEANIKSEHYFTAAQGVDMADHGMTDASMPPELMLLTFCVLVLRNGFTVTGESACASPANFNAEIGRRIARENAVAKIWPLMGYELRSKLAGQGASKEPEKPKYTIYDIAGYEVASYGDLFIAKFKNGMRVEVRNRGNASLQDRMQAAVNVANGQ